MRTPSRTLAPAGLQLGLLALLVGCGSTPATDSADGSTSTSAGASSEESSGDIDPSTSTAGIDDTGSTSDGSSSSDTGDTTGGDTEAEVELCDPEDFSTDSAVSMRDPMCVGGDRCSATAACTLGASAGLNPRTERWEYELSCDGEWTDIDDKETTPLEDAVVLLYSANELDLEGVTLDYAMSTDYADRFGGVDDTSRRLSVDGVLMAHDGSSELGIGAAGLSAMTFEESSCDPADVSWISETCAWPRGLIGEGPDGEEVRVVNDMAFVGDWLVSSRGWESCGDFPGAYRRDLSVSAVRVSLIVP